MLDAPTSCSFWHSSMKEEKVLGVIGCSVSRHSLASCLLNCASWEVNHLGEHSEASCSANLYGLTSVFVIAYQAEVGSCTCD